MYAQRIALPTAQGTSRGGNHVIEMQRRRLLLGFAEVLADAGLEQASVGRICKRAGVSRRTFYDLFESREACFRIVVEDTLARIAQRALPAYEREGGRWSERVRAALAALLSFFDQEPVLARVCLGETLKGDPTVRHLRERAIDALAAAVDEGRSEAKSDIGLAPITAPAIVGGAISVAHTRVLDPCAGPLIELLNPLMSMVLLPYLGPAAARRELDRSVPPIGPAANGDADDGAADPFKDLPIRITFRTARVLAMVAAHPGASNRQIGEAAGVPDQGQISKLLRRLAGYGLVENNGRGHPRGEPNAWFLTNRGNAVQQAIQLPQN